MDIYFISHTGHPVVLKQSDPQTHGCLVSALPVWSFSWECVTCVCHKHKPAFTGPGNEGSSSSSCVFPSMTVPVGLEPRHTLKLRWNSQHATGERPPSGSGCESLKLGKKLRLRKVVSADFFWTINQEQ